MHDPKRPDGRALSADALRDLFEHGRAPSFGIEEELMVLHPDTLDLAPWAPSLLADLDGGEQVKLELPASQLEIVTAPHATVGAAVADLRERRRALARAVGSRAFLAAAGAHPFAAPEGELNEGSRYERIAREYGAVARRQLVCGLHVHIGLAGADRALAVYNALRSYLPQLAALGANAPLRGGRDSGFASIRPLLSGLLPRQGVPPAYASWEQLAGDLQWGAATGALSGLLGWWWELRLHAELGTLEIRVPDAQSSLADAAALAAVSAALAVWLARRFDAGELEPLAPAWRIAENSWSAARHGVKGELVDLQSGRAVATRERLHRLFDELAPVAATIDARDGLERAYAMAESNGAEQQRRALAQGPRAAAELLCEAFLAG